MPLRKSINSPNQTKQNKTKTSQVSMSGTLTFPTVPSLRLPRDNNLLLAGATRSDRKMSFNCRNPSKSAIHAFTATAPPPSPVMETRRSASLYEVLGIVKSASPAEIKLAYRSLAKMYHPDASDSESDGRDFIEIHDAYATLSDPTARALYDLSLRIGSGRRSFDYSASSGFYPTRRWETDQCW